MNKKKLEKAIDDLNFIQEGEYITKDMAESKEIILKYIKETQKNSISKKTIIKNVNRQIKEIDGIINNAKDELEKNIAKDLKIFLEFQKKELFK